MIITEVSSFQTIPKRIISLVPSITELLSYLGLEEETVGITKFCVRPEDWFRTKKRIGGTKTLDTDLIVNLKPDLVIANKEENLKEQVELISQTVPVLLTDVSTLEDALQMILDISQITGKRTRGAELHSKMSKDFSSLATLQQQTAVYLIWKDPLMTVGGDTYISDLMNRCGFQNVYSGAERYPVIDIEDIKTKKPALLLLSSEPYPFTDKHTDYFARQLPGTKIIIVDGEMFSWYGSRLLEVPSYFRSLAKLLTSSAV
jgi:ABC-type Fe3+-hydroxamate transport system substrate-binding protein